MGILARTIKLVVKREKIMQMNQHLTALQFRHSGLEKKIANENKRPLPDYLILKQLKKKRLYLKEEMKLHLA